MFMDSLDGGEVVVPAAKVVDEEAWAERKKFKSLRNQRNRILNKFKREANDDPELQKYLPVHLRNLPDPTKKNKKGSKDSSLTSPPVPPPVEERSKDARNHRPTFLDAPPPPRQRFRQDNDLSSSRKRPSPDTPSSPSLSFAPQQDFKRPRAEAPAPAAPVIAAAVTTGKDWQQTGIHPSWAAKQMKAQQAIKIDAAPQAKKIIFDD